jgi:hypothetical protein
MAKRPEFGTPDDDAGLPQRAAGITPAPALAAGAGGQMR